MSETDDRYVPALGYHWLTRLYDPVVALTTRERTFKRELIRQAAVVDGHRVLDLACGTGTLALWLKEAAPGAHVCGVDGDDTVLAIAAAKARKTGTEIQLRRGLSFELPYPDDTFDRVLSSLFFHHLSSVDKLRTVREVARVLKPDGQFHVADWGRAGNRLMRWLFLAIQLLDGFDNTRDNVEGRLPSILREGGFAEVETGLELSTVFGTLSLLSACGLASGAGGIRPGRDGRPVRTRRPR